MPSLTLPGAPDRSSRAIVVGFGATLALLLAYLASYALAHLFALAAPSASLSHRLIAGWLRALSQSEVVDPGQPAFFAALGLQIAIGLVGAAVYASAAEPRLGGPVWLRGVLFALALWLVTQVVALPLLGAGIFGEALGAGPLPAYATLLAYGLYGLILGPAYAASDDLVWVSGARPAGALVSGWMETARGLGAGAAFGGALGLALGLLVPWQSPMMSGSLMPLALMLSFGLAGGAVGELVGSLSALPTAVSCQLSVVSVAAGPVAVVRPSAAEALLAPAALDGRMLRVVAAHGACHLGYKPGDTFHCGRGGDLEPGVCPAAQETLRPLLSAMAESRSGAPSRVCCPIYDHMLVFEMVPAAA